MTYELEQLKLWLEAQIIYEQSQIQETTKLGFVAYGAYKAYQETLKWIEQEELKAPTDSIN